MEPESSTDDLITRLSRGPGPKPVWLTYPVVPLVLLIVGGLVINSFAGMHFITAAMLSRAGIAMATAYLIFATLGLWICLGLLSPVERIGKRWGLLIAVMGLVSGAWIWRHHRSARPRC